MTPTDVVTAFLRHGTDVLLVERSDAVGTYAGRWGGVSGYVEGAPRDAVRREIDEEVGQADPVLELVRSGEPLEIADTDVDRRWRVHPFLFETTARTVEPNEEIARYEWVQPPAILERETVPGLWEAYAAVAPTLETVAADATHGSAFLSLRALEVLRDAAATAARRPSPQCASSTDDDHDRESPDGDLEAFAGALRDARPSMGVLRVRIDRVMTHAGGTAASIRDAAVEACRRAVDADAEAARVAADHLGDRVLTLSRSGTVAAALRRAEPAVVFVAESRPAREGIDVAETLAADGLDVTVHVDAAIAHVVETAAVDTVAVGADSVLADGTLVNKVGTRLAALAAAETDADCVAICARDKIVPETSFDPDAGPSDAVYDGDAPVAVENPTFEATPATHVDAILTEDGALDRDAVAAVADDHAELASWTA